MLITTNAGAETRRIHTRFPSEHLHVGQKGALGWRCSRNEQDQGKSITCLVMASLVLAATRQVEFLRLGRARLGQRLQPHWTGSAAAPCSLQGLTFLLSETLRGCPAEIPCVGYYIRFTSYLKIVNEDLITIVEITSRARSVTLGDCLKQLMASRCVELWVGTLQNRYSS